MNRLTCQRGQFQSRRTIVEIEAWRELRRWCIGLRAGTIVICLLVISAYNVCVGEIDSVHEILSRFEREYRRVIIPLD